MIFWSEGSSYESGGAERNAKIRRDHPDPCVSRQYGILSIGRSSFYYRPKGESAETLALMRRIDELFLKYPFYGNRQMARQLRREGVCAGRHRVRRLMRLMGLQAIYQAPRTSTPHAAHQIYPYLLKGMVIDRPDRVWCADITYIPIQRGFLYLVAISMDGRGRCLDNIFTERLWRSLKYEAADLYELTDGFRAEQVIGEWRSASSVQGRAARGYDDG
jgi:transposase InsO family protein